MSFQAPAFLLGLLAVPAVVALYVAYERRAARGRRAFAAPALMPAVAPRRPRWRRHVPIAVYGLALALLVVALARPQRSVAVPVEQATVMLVTDRSGSMRATDVAPTRIDAAKRAAARFLDVVPARVRVGAVAFNTRAELLEAPTNDHDTVRSALRDVRARGHTATGEGLNLALQIARRPTRPGAKAPPAAIVLLSDGKSVAGRDPLGVAREAGRAKIPVYTIALGTPDGTIQTPNGDGTVRTERVPPDPQSMSEIARLSGGQTFTAGDEDALKRIYERLGSQVAKVKRPRQITASVAGGALALLVLAAAASLRWFGRPV